MKISSDRLRMHKTLHSWVGIVAGIVLFIGFFGGALTMFEDALDDWSHAPAHAQDWTRTYQPADYDRLLQDVLAGQPDARESVTLYLESSARMAGPVSWARGREADLGAEQWFARLEQGQTLIETQPQSGAGTLVDLLHRTAGIPGLLGGEYLGGYILGVAALLYFLALLSGLILLLPSLVRDFFKVRAGTNIKRFWLDVHNVLGITSLPFHLVISLTVVVFAFHDQFYGALAKVVYPGERMFSRPAAAASPYDPHALMPVSVLLSRIGEEAPGFTVRELMFRETASTHPLLRVALESEREVMHGPRHAYLVLHPYTGAVLDSSMLPGHETFWSGAVNLAFALHFGSFGGWPVRFLYFALGLGGAMLFYTGNLLWLESRRRRAGAAPEGRSSRWLAALTLGGCMGSVCAVAGALLVGKGFNAYAGVTAWVYLSTYYLIFVGALLWAFWRGAARSALPLLRVLAGLCFAMPLLSLILNLQADAGVPGGSALAVDFGALVVGLAACWMLRVTRRRLAAATSGVWHLEGALLPHGRTCESRSG